MAGEGYNRRHLHLETGSGEISIAQKLPLYFAVFDLEKAFDLVPRKVIW